MTEFAKPLVDFFLNERNKISKRIFIFTFIFSVIILFDNQANFSYSYRRCNQIQQLSELNTLINKTEDEKIVAKLKDIQIDILEKKPFLNESIDFISSLSFNSIKFIDRFSYKISENISYNKFYHFVTINWLFIVFFVVGLITVPIEYFKKKKPFAEMLGGIIALFVIFTPTMMFFSWLMGIFQPIFDNNILNYGINILIFLLPALASGMSKKKKKQP